MYTKVHIVLTKLNTKCIFYTAEIEKKTKTVDRKVIDNKNPNV